MKIFSFFAGSGFLDLGFENNGFDIVFVNEFDPQFLKAYQYARNNMGIKPPVYGYYNDDINVFLNDKDKRNELTQHIDSARKGGSLIGFIGGPPCPDFSIAGKNRGKDGDRGKLSLSYVNLIIQRQPDFFLFENVKGLWSTKRHRDFFNELKEMLRQSGYATTERLVNALEYGTPQDRQRILFFGIKSNLLGRRQEAGTIMDFPWNENKVYTMEQVNAARWPEIQDFIEGVGTTYANRDTGSIDHPALVRPKPCDDASKRKPLLYPKGGTC